MFELIVPAFLAGLLTFVMPCTLPLLPVYISILSGSATRELDTPEKTRRAGRKMIWNGVFFVLGFSIVFILLGFVASSLFQLLGPNFRSSLTSASGFIIVFFGLVIVFMQLAPWLQTRFGLGLPFFSKLQGTYKLQLPEKLKNGTPIASFLVGFTFAFGWSPCIGPILGSLIGLAANSDTGFQGVLLLGVFSVGLAIPFILIALLLSFGIKTLSYIRGLNKYSGKISVVGGTVMILIGVLIATGDYNRFFIDIDTQLTNTINYEGILDRL